MGRYAGKVLTSVTSYARWILVGRILPCNSPILILLKPVKVREYPRPVPQGHKGGRCEVTPVEKILPQPCSACIAKVFLKKKKKWC